MAAKRSKRIMLTKDVDRNKLNKETIKWFKKYQMEMSLKELSPKTIYNYETDLYAWFSYIYLFQDNKSILEVDEDDLQEFFYYCKSEGNNSRRIKRRMAPISMIYQMLRKKKQISENPMEFIERPRKDTDVVVQTFLTQEQINLMKEKLTEYGDLQLLTYAMLSLSTMARVNAMSNITWDQIDFQNNSINDVLEKEGYIVELDFDDYCKDLLLKLQVERKEKNINCEYVFISKYKNIYDKVENSTMNTWCKKIGELINVPTLHCHDFRHSGATLLKNAGMTLEEVSSLLNHAGTDVTMKHYIKEDKTKLKARKKQFSFL